MHGYDSTWLNVHFAILLVASLLLRIRKTASNYQYVIYHNRSQWCRQVGARGFICTQSMHLCTHSMHV